VLECDYVTSITQAYRTQIYSIDILHRFDSRHKKVVGWLIGVDAELDMGQFFLTESNPLSATH